MSEAVEIQHVICRECEIEKIRVKSGKFNLKDFRWVDEEGSLWNGRVCPECHRKNARTRGVLKRVKGD